MRRRDLIAMLSGAAVAWPLAARAQQRTMPVIGYLSPGSPDRQPGSVVRDFRRGLSENGYVEGQNVAIEFRWAEGHYDRLPALAAELVRARVSVLVAVAQNALVASVAATRKIPIVFETGIDPVRSGIAKCLNRPGGNATGVSMYAVALEAKKLQLLHESGPKASTIAVLMNSSSTAAATLVGDLDAGAARFGGVLRTVPAANDRELGAAFAAIKDMRADALQVAADPFLSEVAARIVAFAADQRLPAIYTWRDMARAGGLMSYGADLPEVYYRMGILAAKILKGTKPSDLPIEQPTRFEFVVNLKTAAALGLTIPPTLLARADEVIE